MAKHYKDRDLNSEIKDCIRNNGTHSREVVTTLGETVRIWGVHYVGELGDEREFCPAVKPFTPVHHRYDEDGRIDPTRVREHHKCGLDALYEKIRGERGQR